MRNILILAIFYCQLAVGQGNDTAILGRWKSVDDNTGQIRSIVEITSVKGVVTGKILKVYPQPGEDPDPVCNLCAKEDQRYMKKIIGMVIITGMTAQGDAYEGGTILDPESGKVYRCKLWREQNNLMVRGYWGPFYRTQTWKPEP